MRFMLLMIPKGYEEAAPGTIPEDLEAVEAMMKFNQEMEDAGILEAADGLHPPSMGARVSFGGGKPSVVDGPFAEAKEVLGGYWIINVASKEEAVAWASRCPGSENETIEVRQLQAMEDFPEDYPTMHEGVDQTPTPQMIFVNLPVKDLQQSVAFFTKLGYTFNEQFTDEKATAMVVSDTIIVMLLVEDYFKTFTDKPVADAKHSTEALVALSAGSREEVDRIVETALGNGARRFKEPDDHGFMYGWAFEDLDGHIWEYTWMDPAAMQG